MDDKLDKAFYAALQGALFAGLKSFRKEDIFPDLSDADAAKVIKLLGKVIASPEQYITIPTDEVE